jgi:transcription antitermination protein NusB
MQLDNALISATTTEVVRYPVDESTVIHCKDLNRRDVRSLIFHLLYTAEALEYQESLESMVLSYYEGFLVDIPFDSDVFKSAQAIISERAALDQLYCQMLTNWRFDRIGISTKLILRYAFWELDVIKVEPRIAINEAVELAKCFAEYDAHRFINGVLDKFVQQRNEHNNAMPLTVTAVK